MGLFAPKDTIPSVLEEVVNWGMWKSAAGDCVNASDPDAGQVIAGLSKINPRHSTTALEAFRLLGLSEGSHNRLKGQVYTVLKTKIDGHMYRVVTASCGVERQSLF